MSTSSASPPLPCRLALRIQRPSPLALDPPRLLLVLDTVHYSICSLLGHFSAPASKHAGYAAEDIELEACLRHVSAEFRDVRGRKCV